MKNNDHTQKYKDLRKQYPVFCYESFKYEYSNQSLIIEYHFSLSDHYHFYPKHEFPIPNNLIFSNSLYEELNNLVFHLGMIEVISYWKTACSPILKIKPYSLNNEQISWWKKLYFHGLGEFFYLNGIETNVDDFLDIHSGSKKQVKPFQYSLEDKVLVPVGGGKDSIVTLETLKKLNKKLIPLVINPRGATNESIINTGFNITDAYLTKRSIHPQLLELNQQGFLNGHTPFSAMLAFLSLIAARLNNTKYIALSNESSANESTVNGTNINHQYSKSFQFEQDFRNYYQKYICSDFEYFSFLRPISELQIASLFAQYPNHYFSFKSCNVGSKENIWCGSCPKCLFTYILMSPFISASKQHQIFGKAMLSDYSLQPILNELRGKTESKPFECVGTIDEVEWSLKHAFSEYYNEFLLKESGITPSNNHKEVLKSWNSQHFLKKEFEEVLKNSLMIK